MPGNRVPHSNAWAIADGDGIVLIDCGMHTQQTPETLKEALRQCGLKLSQVRHLVCTHAHADHCGAASAVIARSSCDLWIHPAYHSLPSWRDPHGALRAPDAVNPRHGVPREALQAWMRFHEEDRRAFGTLVSHTRPLTQGTRVATDLGPLIVHETPGHAASHVCLHEPQRGLLFTGDHVMGKISVFFEIDTATDPVADFLQSLDTVDQLQARLALSGHGRTFTRVRGHADANRALVRTKLSEITTLLQGGQPRSAYQVMVGIYQEPPDPIAVYWWMSVTLAYLRHLEAAGMASRIDGDTDHWCAS